MYIFTEWDSVKGATMGFTDGASYRHGNTTDTVDITDSHYWKLIGEPLVHSIYEPAIKLYIDSPVLNTCNWGVW